VADNPLGAQLKHFHVWRVSCLVFWKQNERNIITECENRNGVNKSPDNKLRSVPGLTCIFGSARV
jgi:hypothetical protein